MSINNSNGNEGVTKRILERKTATAVSTKYKIDFSFRREVFFITVTSCKLCKPSDHWLGKFSTKPQIKNGKLWLSQHLDSIRLSDSDEIF
jgi:hypothetical protein